ncbi:MAG: DMT family transporter [Pseudomonadota bacterium]
MAAILALAAFVTGVFVPVQLALNGQLGTALKSAYLGAFFVFVTGVAAMGLVLAVSRTGLPSPATLASVPPVAWLGGVIATVYILAVVILVPRLGVGATAALIIAGQVAGALALDHFGAIGTAEIKVNATRLLGGAAVVGGALLVRLGG